MPSLIELYMLKSGENVKDKPAIKESECDRKSVAGRENKGMLHGEATLIKYLID